MATRYYGGIDFMAPARGAAEGRRDVNEMYNYQANAARQQFNALTSLEQLRALKDKRTAYDYLVGLSANRQAAKDAGMSMAEYIDKQYRAILEDPNFLDMDVGQQEQILSSFKRIASEEANKAYTSGDKNTANAISRAIGSVDIISPSRLAYAAGNVEAGNTLQGYDLGFPLNTQGIDPEVLRAFGGDVQGALRYTLINNQNNQDLLTRLGGINYTGTQVQTDPLTALADQMNMLNSMPPTQQNVNNIPVQTQPVSIPTAQPQAVPVQTDQTGMLNTMLQTLQQNAVTQPTDVESLYDQLRRNPRYLGGN